MVQRVLVAKYLYAEPQRRGRGCDISLETLNPFGCSWTHFAALWAPFWAFWALRGTCGFLGWHLFSPLLAKLILYPGEAASPGLFVNQECVILSLVDAMETNMPLRVFGLDQQVARKVQVDRSPNVEVTQGGNWSCRANKSCDAGHIGGREDGWQVSP